MTTPVPSMSQKSAMDGMRDIFITVLLRPIDNDWIMGDDLPVTFHFEVTIMGLKKYLEETRGISRHRQQIRPLFKRSGNKIIPSEKEGWTLKRLGIENNTIVTVEPTLSGERRENFFLQIVLE